MDFLAWWFMKHYIISTLLTPGMTLAWAIYKGLVVRALVAFFLMLLGIGVSAVG